MIARREYRTRRTEQWYVALAATLAVSTGACCPSSLNADIRQPGARASMAGAPSATPVVGLFHEADWPSEGLPKPPAAEGYSCRQDRAELEAWLGRRAQECGRIRGKAAQPTGDMDKDTSVSVAPSCYGLGKAILVVEYESTAACTRVVGLSLVASD